MPTIDQIKNTLLYLGFSPDKITPLVIVALGLYFFITKNISKVKDRAEDIEKCIIEIQTSLRTKYKMQFQQIIANKYGEAHSPMVLKNEFREFITEPKLDKQIKNKKKDLLKWLNKQKPQTGLDAQDDISNFVSSNEVTKYLDLTEYKQNLGGVSEYQLNFLMLTKYYQQATFAKRFRQNKY